MYNKWLEKQSRRLIKPTGTLYFKISEVKKIIINKNSKDKSINVKESASPV